MSEGFFDPSRCLVPGLSPAALREAMVRVLPKTVLVLDLAATAEEAHAKARNEVLPDGSECWYRFFTRDEMAKVDDPRFALGMVRHEFAGVVRRGAGFPATVPLDGGGTGFAVSPQGHVLTNYHLVTSEIANHERKAGALNVEVPCKSLRVQLPHADGSGAWEWRDADAVWLVSNPPAVRALSKDPSGISHPREDTALLRVSPAPTRHFRLSRHRVAVSEPLWMAGFPLRSARSKRSLEALGYDDADGTLRVSTGTATEVDGDSYFTTDIDGSMGNSGSPVFDRSGLVVGLFSRASGNGPINAFEYGHLRRIHVCSALAIDGLGMNAILDGKA